MRAEHIFQGPGDTCGRISPKTNALCGLAESVHRKSRKNRDRCPTHVPRPEHHPVEDPCIFTSIEGKICGLPAEYHRLRDRLDRAQERDWTKDRPGRIRPTRPSRSGRYQKSRSRPYRSQNADDIVGIDGEGQGRHITSCFCAEGPLEAPSAFISPKSAASCIGCDHPVHRKGKCRVGIPTGDTHRYTYLAAVDEHGSLKGEIRNPHGLPTVDCLNFFLDLGVRRVFGFAIGYDLTKILSDLSAKHIYFLNRPDARKAKRCDGSTYLKPVDWRGFRLGYLRGQLTLRRIQWSKTKKKNIATGAVVILWDCFRFFQSKFTTALLDWKIAPKEKLERMMRMKDLRSEFDRLSQREIEDYCKEECHYLAQLVRKLIEAHEAVDLKLKNFFGAGSTATALLNKLEIRKHLEPVPSEMRDVVARGFFGGRFEISRVGPIHEAVYNYDISSAYPYHITHLPCLACGGRWELAKGKGLQRRIERGRLALVHALPTDLGRHAPEAWGPFPWRSPDGSILFPRASGGVWVWQDEFLTAQKIFPQVTAREAWVFEAGCDHQPFAGLPEIYRERLRIGKEGPGIVLKLGPNSIYGKTAQSKGQAPFQNFIWAGVITSNTRAQLLHAFAGLAPEAWWDVLMFATDGIFSKVPLSLPAPRDTGTAECPDENGKLVKKPLGGWELNTYQRGIFILRPGIYFPLSATANDMKEIKARGMSKAVLLDNAKAIEAHYKIYGITKPFEVDGLSRFVGMVSGVLKGTEETGPKRSENYGEWIPYPIQASFSPLPKRKRLLPGNRLEAFRRMAGESLAYKRANLSPEGEGLREAESYLSEQASGDFGEFS